MTGYVGAATSRAHVMRLRGHGWTVQEVADAAGLPVPTINSLLYRCGRKRHQRYVQADTAARILAVPIPAAVQDRDLKAARQLQALAVLGWSARRLAAMVGVSLRTLQSVRSGERGTSARVWAAIDAVYQRLSMTPCTEPGAAVVRGRALTAGWVPPLAWDDHQLTDPQAQPHGIREAA